MLFKPQWLDVLACFGHGLQGFLEAGAESGFDPARYNPQTDPVDSKMNSRRVFKLFMSRFKKIFLLVF
jgi:hypothetical protein